MQPSSYRVTSLTAEGGRLKSSPRLTRGKDFELIPERLWKALVQWYGGSPSLPRQVIRTKEGNVELELYPLSVKLMKHQTVARPASANNNNVGSMPTLMGGYSAAGGAAMVTPYSSMSNSSSSVTNTNMPSTMRRYHAYQCGFSRRTTVKQINDFLSTRLHIKMEDMRLWLFR